MAGNKRTHRFTIKWANPFDFSSDIRITKPEIMKKAEHLTSHTQIQAHYDKAIHRVRANAISKMRDRKPPQV